MEPTIKKYELTGETKVVNGVTLHRIRALLDIPLQDVKAGRLGGWVQSEENLSQEKSAWIHAGAQVYGSACVYGNASVAGKARVYGSAEVRGRTKVYGSAQVYGKARVYGRAIVAGRAQVYGGASIYGKAMVYGSAQVYGKARVYGNVEVFGRAKIYERARLSENAWIYGKAELFGKARMYGEAEVCGGVWPCSPFHSQGTRNCVCTPDHEHIQIGCRILTPGEWEVQYEALGKKYLYTEGQIQEYKLLIDTATAWLKSEPWVTAKARKAA